MHTVLRSGKFLNDNLAALNHQLDVLARDLSIPRYSETVFGFTSDSDHVAVVDFLPSLFSVLARDCYEFKHAWPFHHAVGQMAEMPKMCETPNLFAGCVQPQTNVISYRQSCSNRTFTDRHGNSSGLVSGGIQYA